MSCRRLAQQLVLVQLGLCTGLVQPVQLGLCRGLVLLVLVQQVRPG